MKLITVLSFLIPFLLQSIYGATSATELSVSTQAIPTTNVRSGNNFFLLSDFPFMVKIKIYKNEILLCRKIGGFITERWIIMTPYYEDNTPYLIFEILSLRDYPRDGINTTKYFPYPKQLEHGNFVNNIALVDTGRDISNYFMKLPNYGVNWPSSTYQVYKLLKFTDDDIVNMKMVQKYDRTQKCHENMFELCYNDSNNNNSNNIESNTLHGSRLNLDDIFFIHYDINNSPVLIGIQTASQQQAQNWCNDRISNRFLSIAYFWKWICAVTGINYV